MRIPNITGCFIPDYLQDNMLFHHHCVVSCQVTYNFDKNIIISQTQPENVTEIQGRGLCLGLVTSRGFSANFLPWQNLPK